MTFTLLDNVNRRTSATLHVKSDGELTEESRIALGRMVDHALAGLEKMRQQQIADMWWDQQLKDWRP